MGGTNDVVKKFREPGIADRVMSLLKFADKKPENLAIALGINRVSGYEAQLEAAMDQLIRELKLPITKTLHGGLTETGQRKQGSYVVYGLKRSNPPVAAAGPQLKTYKINQLPREEEMGVRTRDEAVRAFKDALKKLPELADCNLNQAYVLQTLAGLGNAWLYSPQNEIFRVQLKEALLAERKRRQEEFDGADEVAKEGEIDLAATILSLRAQIEELQQRNDQLERANHELRETACEENFTEIPSDAIAGLEARLESLEQAIESLTVEIKAAEGERDRLTQKRDAIQEVIELLR